MPSIDDLRRTTDDFAAGVANADPFAPVPSCPEWTVEDLVTHLGWVHLWAAGAVREAANTNPPEASTEDRKDLAGLYRRSADDLIDALSNADADDDAWSFSKNHRNAGFWLRRQVHETAMHGWDLAAASGSSIGIEPRLAWDGVEEIRDVFYPRQVSLGRTEPLPGRLVIRATDVEGEPVELGEGVAYELSGTASNLLLLLWKRRANEDAGLDGLLDRALTP